MHHRIHASSSRAFTYPPATTSPQDGDTPDVISLFQHVDREVLTAILNHELPAAQLYKLDTRRLSESDWQMVDLQDSSSPSFRCVPSTLDIYRTLDSLLVPLNTYFSILCVHGLSNGQPATLPCHFFRYSSHLVKVAAQYEWQAVLLYHFAFFARRCSEMLAGNYAGWDKIDVDLMEELLLQHRKPQTVRRMSPLPHPRFILICSQHDQPLSPRGR